MAKLAIVYHSGYGHTKVQAEHVLSGVRAVPGISATLLTTDEAMKDLAVFDDAECIVFGCPTYMGGPSAQFKAFADATSKIWFNQGWRNKLAAGFTNSQGPSGDKLNTLEYLTLLAMQHSMIWVGTGFLPGANNTKGDEELNRLSSFIGAMSQSPFGSTEPVPADLKTAEAFGRRIGEVTVLWSKAIS